jgi:predicted alpha/beta hydrolase
MTNTELAIPSRTPLNQLLWQYSYLQILDFLTTVAFLLQGVREGNPLVRLALSAGANPLAILGAVKLLAIMLGLYCWFRGRRQLLVRINILFALLVAWNLVALILRSATS